MKNLLFTPRVSCEKEKLLVSNKKYYNYSILFLASFMLFFNAFSTAKAQITIPNCVWGDCTIAYPGWRSDSIEVEVPGFPGCSTKVYFIKGWCEGAIQTNAMIKITNMVLSPNGCSGLNTLLFPNGESQPFDEIQLRLLWQQITRVVFQEELKRYLTIVSPAERANFDCLNGTLSYKMTSIEGHCQSACVGTYVDPLGMRASIYDISYKTCDEYSCCWVTHYFCIFNNGTTTTSDDQVEWAKTEIDGVESAYCDNRNPASNCIFLTIPGMHLTVHHSPCRVTCNYGTYYPD